MSVINKTIKALLASFILIGALSFSQSSFAFCSTLGCETYEDALAYCSTRRLAHPPPTYQWCSGPDAPKCAYCRIVPGSSPTTNPQIEFGRWSEYLGVFLFDPLIPLLNRYPTSQDYTKSVGGISQASAPNSAANITPKSCNPINIASGNKFKKQTDIVNTTYNLGFSRYYNSRTGYVGNLGKKWTHSYSRQLKSIGALNWQLIRANGKGINYITLGDDSPSTADGDITATLSKLKDNTGTQIGWQYRGHDNTQENYDLNGRLTSIIYLNGNTETITYDTSNRISQVVNRVGYSLTFSYGANNRLQNLTDQSGRVWVYNYDVNNNLKEVINADSTKRTYLYTNPTFVNLLTGIIDERGLHYASYEYDTKAKATASYLGPPTNVLTARISGISLVHNSDGSKTLTDSRGNVSNYQTTTLLGLSIVTQATGSACPGCGPAIPLIAMTLVITT